MLVTSLERFLSAMAANSPSMAQCQHALKRQMAAKPPPSLQSLIVILVVPIQEGKQHERINDLWGKTRTTSSATPLTRELHGLVRRSSARRHHHVTRWWHLLQFRSHGRCSRCRCALYLLCGHACLTSYSPLIRRRFA